MPCPPPGRLPNPGIKLTSLCFLHYPVGSLPLEPPGKPIKGIYETPKRRHKIGPEAGQIIVVVGWTFQRKKSEKFQHRVAKSPLLIPLSILHICCDICVSHPSSGYLQVFFSFQFRRFWGMALSASLQQRAMEQVQCMLITLSTSRFLGSEFLETFPIVSFLMKPFDPMRP